MIVIFAKKKERPNQPLPTPAPFISHLIGEWWSRRVKAEAWCSYLSYTSSLPVAKLNWSCTLHARTQQIIGLK